MNGPQRNHKAANQSTAPRNDGIKLRPAIFLDRDGTVTDEVGYINHVSRAKIYPYAAEAVRMLKSTGLPVIIVTNQSGVGRGYFTEEIIGQVHQMVRDALRAAGTSIDAFYHCPHHPGAVVAAYRQECRCRKPGTGMPEQAAEEHGIDLSASYVVGDTYRDMQMGFNIGARTVLLMTGYGRGEYEYRRAGWTRMPDLVAENLLEAAKLIVQELNATVGANPMAQSILS
jgi:D-glycero-D-manno-heptose 1,7-bisphosphate phosphatase